MAPLLGSRYTKEHKTKEFIHMWIHCQWKIRESEYSSGIGTGWPGQRNAKFLRDLKDWEPVKGKVEEKGQLLWGLGRSTKGTCTGQKQVASMAERERDGDRRLEAPGSARKGFRHWVREMSLVSRRRPESFNKASMNLLGAWMQLCGGKKISYILLLLSYEKELDNGLEIVKGGMGPAGWWSTAWETPWDLGAEPGRGHKERKLRRIAGTFELENGWTRWVIEHRSRVAGIRWRWHTEIRKLSKLVWQESRMAKVSKAIFFLKN